MHGDAHDLGCLDLLRHCTVSLVRVSICQEEYVPIASLRDATHAGLWPLELTKSHIQGSLIVPC